MGRRAARGWDPQDKPADEVDRRNREIELLNGSEQWLLATLRLATRYAPHLPDAVIQAGKRLLKRITEARRQGPDRIARLRADIDAYCRPILVDLPKPPATSVEKAGSEIDQWLETLEIARDEPIGTSGALAVERARLQARIVAPVLRNVQSGKAAAQEWRDRFRAVARGEVIGDIADIPRQLCLDYIDLHPVTVNRWAEKIRKARRKAARTRSPIPTDVEVLRHRKPADASTKRRKRTPELHVRVVEALLADPDQTAGDIAAQIGKVSARTIRRTIRALPPALVSLLRGGSEAAEEILYSRLPRPATRFLEVVQIDDSCIKMEIVDGAIIPDFEDFDFEFHCVERRPQQGGQWLAQRVERMYLQAIVDAYSRVKLVHRLFPYPPTSTDTLVTLAIAAFNYGIPEVVYSDNGANFTSHEVRRRLESAGVRQVFSRPAHPKGRGIVENWFRNIKRSFFDKMPGSRHRPTTLDHLLELSVVQKHLNRFVEAHYNQAYHRGIGMTPRERMERSLSGPATSDPKLILRLLPVTTAIKESSAVHFANGVYWCPDLVLVPNRSRVNVYTVPLQYEMVWLTWVPNGGSEEVFLGPAQRIDEANPAPDIGATREAETAVLQEVLGDVLPRIGEQARQRRRLADQIRAEKEAEADAADLVAILAKAKGGRLPAPTPGELLAEPDMPQLPARNRRPF